MKIIFSQFARALRVFFLLTSAWLIAAPAISAQDKAVSGGKDLYTQIKSFSLTGGSASVKELTLNRDRVRMTFDGTFYFTAPIDGHVTGAVFVGNGTFTAEVPPNGFEKDNVKRLLGADLVASDFKTAVFRFSDDTFERLAVKPGAGQADERAQKLATELEPRMLKETGANLSARLALSIINQEKPGFFFANFDGGKRGRFNLMLDYQNRIPVANFDINGGEKGLIFQYDSTVYSPEIWMAFYGQEDYERGSVTYSDFNNLIDVVHYDLRLDLREHKKYLRLQARAESVARAANIRAIPFIIGEDLGEADSWRLKKQLRLQQARLGDVELPFAQEDWEGGFTIFLPEAVAVGQKLDLDLTLQGDFMYDAQSVEDCHYPRSNSTWYPRHGYLDRATFDLTFRHPKKLKIASGGLRLSENPDADDKDAMVTRYTMTEPVPLITFALAPFERHTQTVRFDKGGVGDPIPIEFNSLPGSIKAIKEDFILAELDNSLRYFTTLFGKYPYPTFGAAFHPFNFGQGFPTLLMIPATDRASKFTYVFVAHETAHQWWGDIVSWRSYRDQWLSEGFAEYSGILYTGQRAGAGAGADFISALRESLRQAPMNRNGGRGEGRLVDVGPIILGHRLDTSKTRGAYQTLIYNKGALVLRMLHFLLTDPNTGEGKGFFDMMTDFVNRYHNKFASTDDFRVVANEHFARSPIARIYHLNNLDWFFKQWVYETDLPSYQMEYQLQDQPDGKVLLTGTVTQENTPKDWFMVLPIVMYFGGKQEAHATVHGLGPSATFQLRLPARPTKIELDPHHWVLSEKTATKGN
ncbi:MAG TPA: M1 family aminopeptidase [Pyrinomonadaceae bacterium]|nr:M1 family aminopeptidase [Pyrinomonadaceae bacterium]